MALVTITGSGGAGTITDRLQTYVQVKDSWTDGWVTVPYLEAVSAICCTAPNTPQASFLYRYGKIKREDSTFFLQYAPLSLVNKYVKIMGVDAAGTRVLWVGIIAKESFSAHGNTDAPQGDQTITAYGLEHLFDRISIVGAMTDEGLIGWCPAFNGRESYGGTLSGNSSGSGLNTVFSKENNLWSNYEIIRYLFRYFCTLPVTLGGQYSSLAFLSGVYNFDGLTIRQAIDKLVDRRRGFSWYVDTTGEGSITLRVFSIYTSSITVGTTVFRGNGNVQEIDLTNDIDVSSNTVMIDQAATYDKIIVQGSRKKACFSISLDDGGLIPAWTELEAEAYKTASEQDRMSQKFEHVFQKYIIPESWDWRTALGERVLDVGDVPWSSPRPLLRWIPIATSGDGEVEYERPMVFVENNGAYSLVDKLPSGSHVRMLDTEKGLALTCSANHVLALNRINFEEDNTPSIPPKYDYQTLHATVAIETDSKVSATVTMRTSADVKRSLVIDVHDAEYWYVAPGTITGVDNGSLTRSTSLQIVRDDSEKLESIATLARSWYSADRASVAVTVKKIINLASLGAIVTSVKSATHTQTANTAVSTRSWDFRQGTTTIKTGFIDLDVRAMLDIPGMSDFRSVGRAFNRQKKEIDELKQRVGSLPSRLAMSSSSQDAEAGVPTVDFIVDNFDREDSDGLGDYWDYGDASPYVIRNGRGVPGRNGSPGQTILLHENSIINVSHISGAQTPGPGNVGSMIDFRIGFLLGSPMSSSKGKAIYQSKLSKKDYTIKVVFYVPEAQPKTIMSSPSEIKNIYGGRCDFGVLGRCFSADEATIGRELVTMLSPVSIPSYSLFLPAVIAVHGGRSHSSPSGALETPEITSCGYTITHSGMNPLFSSLLSFELDQNIDINNSHEDYQAYASSRQKTWTTPTPPEGLVAGLVTNGINTMTLTFSGEILTCKINEITLFSEVQSMAVDGRFVGLVSILDFLTHTSTYDYVGPKLLSFKAWAADKPEPPDDQSGHGKHDGEKFIYTDKYHSKDPETGQITYNSNA